MNSSESQWIRACSVELDICITFSHSDALSLILRHEHISFLCNLHRLLHWQSEVLDDVIDLVIPRGSNALVLRSRDQLKFLFLAMLSADMKLAKRIVLDAKIDYPAACNAMLSLIVALFAILRKLFLYTRTWCQLVGSMTLLLSFGLKVGLLHSKDFSTRLAYILLYLFIWCQYIWWTKASSLLSLPAARSFHYKYNSTACTVEIVDDVYAAIDHIYEHGSAHTDCIVAEDSEAAEVFLRQHQKCSLIKCGNHFLCGLLLIAVLLFSTMQAQDFGLGAEVGISTSRIHARGPVGVEGLLTTRWYEYAYDVLILNSKILRGNGQVVDGDKGVVYVHEDITSES
ncbi:hypothetical protein QYF36_009688 [Acer negundo]|nr:hypothetical protein QYF36_009688 [Acer negundo]